VIGRLSSLRSKKNYRQTHYLKVWMSATIVNSTSLPVKGRRRGLGGISNWTELPWAFRAVTVLGKKTDSVYKWNPATKTLSLKLTILLWQGKLALSVWNDQQLCCTATPLHCKNIRLVHSLKVNSDSSRIRYVCAYLPSLGIFWPLMFYLRASCHVYPWLECNFLREKNDTALFSVCIAD